MIRFHFAFLLLYLTLATSICLAIGTTATADQFQLPTHLSIQIPKNWPFLADLSKNLTRITRETAYLGNLETTDRSLAFGQAEHGALYLTSIRSNAPVENPEQALRVAFNHLHTAPSRVDSPENTLDTAYRERKNNRIQEMTWEWTHEENATLTVIKALGWQDQTKHLHLEIAECITKQQNHTTDRTIRQCRDAVSSLRIRQTVEVVPLPSLEAPRKVTEGIAPIPEIPQLTTGDLSIENHREHHPDSLGEVLYAGNSDREKTDNSHWYWWAIGILLLGLSFFLTISSSSEPNRDQ